MREGYLQTDGGKLWYSVYGGNLKKTPILALHGGPGYYSETTGLEALWEDRPVYFYDQLGCGRSDRAEDLAAYSVEGYIDELAFVRAELKLDRVILLGFSWGCALAVSYLLRDKPDGIEGIVLSAPYLSTPAWDADQRKNIALLPEKHREAIEAGEATGDYGDAYQAAMLEYYHRHLCVLSPWPVSMSEGISRMNTQIYEKLWGKSEFTCTGLLKTFDLRPRLREIAQPVLLTCGDRDEAGVATVKDFQMLFPNAGMAVIPKASHLHQIERPAVYCAIVRDFLQEIYGSQRS